MPASTFKQFIRDHGVGTLAALSEKAQLSYNIVDQLSAATLAPNHPYRVVIARVLNVSAEELADYCKGPALAPSIVQQIRTRLDNRAKRPTALVAPKKAKATATTRNSLKRQAHDLRAAVRGMLTTTNIAVMKGDKYVANMPTEALYLVLTDYAERRGIKTAVVLHPQFADLFD